MFGKPEWFKQKQIGWGLTPVSWQGWIYSAVWLSVISLPFLILMRQGLLFESLIWLGASLVAVVVDVRWILKDLKGAAEKEDVLYIDEDETVSEQFATRNFDFRLRR